MSSRLTTVLAAVGASGALIAGGLAFGGSASADDATDPLHPTLAYSCSGALNVGAMGPVDLPITLDLTPLLPLASAPLASGSSISALPITGTADLTSFVAGLPDAAQQVIASGSVSSVTGNIKNFAMSVGAQNVPLTFKPQTKTIDELMAPNPTFAIDGNVAKAQTVLLPAGSYTVDVPKSFTLALSGVLSGSTVPLGSLTCSDDGNRTLAPVSVTGNPPKPVLASVKAPKTAKVGKSVTVTATVKNTLGGNVSAKLGKKTYKGAVKNGVAKVVVKGIKKGVNKIVVSFPKAKSKTVKVTGKK